MEIDPDTVEFEKVHRLTKNGTNPPIIAKFSRFKQKENVLKQAYKLKDTNINISQDSANIAEINVNN